MIGTEEVGGIRVAKRGIPWWLLFIAVAVLSVAAWYLLSYSSTPYQGSFPRPAAPGGVTSGSESGGH